MGQAISIILGFSAMIWFGRQSYHMILNLFKQIPGVERIARAMWGTGKPSDIPLYPMGVFTGRELEEAKKKAREEAEEAQRQRARAEKAEEGKRDAEEEKRKAVEGKEKAEEEKEKAQEEKREAEEKKRSAEEDAATARAEQQRVLDELQAQTRRADEAERQLKEGTQPIVWPSLEEIADAKIRYGFTEGHSHIAVTGRAGCGKSSLINALRGLTNNDHQAAATGVVETTTQVAGYPDPDPEKPFIWYDIPGAGTLNIPDWQYFITQGLFVFNCIIVLIDIRFSATDIAIIDNSRRFNIPSYIVRSKANQHVLNIMDDMGCDLMTDDGTQRKEMLPVARERFISETHQNVSENLVKAELPPQRVYMVSKDNVAAFVGGRQTVRDPIIDEEQLVNAVWKSAREVQSRATS